MTPRQLSFDASTEPLGRDSMVSGQQHRMVLVALLEAGARGLCGEEAAVRCGIDEAHVASTRLFEMAAENKNRDLGVFPVPLVCRSEKRERPTRRGVRAFIYYLTDHGARVASDLLKEAA